MDERYSSPAVLVDRTMPSPLAMDRKTCRIGESFESLSIFLNKRLISSYMSRNCPLCFSIFELSEGMVKIEFVIYGLLLGFVVDDESVSLRMDRDKSGVWSVLYIFSTAFVKTFMAALFLEPRMKNDNFVTKCNWQHMHSDESPFNGYQLIDATYTTRPKGAWKSKCAGKKACQHSSLPT